MDTFAKIQEVDAQFAELWGRMDDDRDLAYLEKYTMKGTSGQFKDKEIPGTVSVTMNDPAVFLNAVVSWLLGAKWQTRVEGAKSATQERVIEEFLEDVLAAADERLRRRGMVDLFTFLCNHICHRGWIGAKWLLGKQGGNIVLEATPVDMRHCSYEMGKDGLSWVAPTYFRSAEEILSEYPEAGQLSGRDIEVRDYWDEAKNEVYVDGRLVFQQSHKLGQPPFIIQASPAGFMLLDKGYKVREGESIFFLDRGLYSAYNRLISIDVSLSMLSIMPPYQRPVSDMAGPPDAYPGGIGAVTNTQKDDGLFSLLPQPDINMANRVAHTDIGGALQRGGVNNIDLGNITQPTSAIWITEQSEIRSRIQGPRLKALASFYEASARLVIEQFIKGGLEMELGKLGRRRRYVVGQLGNPDSYNITYTLMSRSKKQEIANLAMAQGARGILSDETIIRDLLVSDDPEGELARLQAQKAEAVDPVIGMVRMARALAREAATKTDEVEADGLKLESKLMTERVVAMLKQRQAPEAAAPPGEAATAAFERTPAKNALVPLLGQPGLRGGQGVES